LFFAEAIRADHQLDAFSCGKPALDTWLQQDALRTHKLSTARTTVWVTADSEVVAYSALAGHSLDRADLPKPSQRNMPAAIPAVLIAKMALAEALHGQGHGEDLLLDALHEALRGMQKVGGHYIVVDAIDDEAAAFYRHYDFTPIPLNERRLLMRAADAAASLGLAWP
jgi:GNAT superfamily N-acetyltransferase